MKDNQIDLFEGIDLKNLKVEVIPARQIYPAMFKCIGLIFGLFYLIFLCYGLWAYKINAASPIKHWLIIMLINIPAALLAVGLPILALCGYLFKYQIFKRSIAIHLKHGQAMCELLEKLLVLLLVGFFLIHLLVLALYKCSGESPSLMITALFTSNFIFMIVAAFVGSLFRMEVTRRGIKIGCKTLSDFFASLDRHG